ncbi:MAG: hypothetical protein Q8R51_06905 [Azonexus sp.]|nr:hypothetical protein [Azonexus sp.]
MLLFLIAALRAVIEMLGLCCLAQGFLYLLAGPKRASNPIYQLFAIITHGPRQLVAKCLPVGVSTKSIGLICFLMLVFLWLGLAVMRKFI